jgi:NF-X1-type zinc finger protein NFXL1
MSTAVRLHSNHTTDNGTAHDDSDSDDASAWTVDADELVARVLQSSTSSSSSSSSSSSASLPPLLADLLRDICTRNSLACLVCLGTVRRADPIWSCSRCHVILHLPCIQSWARKTTAALASLSPASSATLPPTLAASHATAPSTLSLATLTANSASASSPSTSNASSSLSTSTSSASSSLSTSTSHSSSSSLSTSTSTASSASTSTVTLTPNSRRSACFACPKCRQPFDAVRDAPSAYRCFCGRTRDPADDPWLLPHSCGSVCGRRFSPSTPSTPGSTLAASDCTHTCLMLCHPGPCPPCPRLVVARCHCGRVEQHRRCHARVFSCEQPCGKPAPSPRHGSGTLDCAHKCSQPCHAGPCPPCAVVVSAPCRCGAAIEQRPCADSIWQCTRPCGRPLACGHHTCQRVCHDGSCGPCPRAASRTCPCGRSASTLPCTEDVPTCGDTCGKLLACGLHRCPERCHRGACSPCSQMVEKECRCRASKRTLPCGGPPFVCDRKCPRERNCGRHQCRRRCCPGIDCPPCEEICNARLPCGNHRCEALCHTGECYPCPRSVVLRCSCGKTELTVPCGSERHVRLPPCPHPCSRPRVCPHPESEHRCHSSSAACRKCTASCGLPLPTCAHLCATRCHAQADGAWVAGKCPPCRVPVTMSCFMGHESRTLPCCDARSYSCGGPCGAPFPCGRCVCLERCSKDHTCNFSCGQRCSLKRPAGCHHECPLACHAGECPPCTVSVSRRCKCGLISQGVPCHELSTRIVDCGQRCQRKMTCGHACRWTCHAGECSPTSECVRKVTVRCPCGRHREEVPCNERELSSQRVQCVAECLQAQQQVPSQEKEQQRTASSGDDVSVGSSDDARISGPRRRRREPAGEDHTRLEQAQQVERTAAVQRWLKSVGRGVRRVLANRAMLRQAAVFTVVLVGLGVVAYMEATR